MNQFSWKSTDGQLSKGLAQSGITILTDLEVKVPMQSIKAEFDHLYRNPDLVNRLNAVYPKRGIFKSNPIFMGHQVDKKVPFDLSPGRLEAIMKNDASLVEELGPEFLDIVSFYSHVQDNIIPRLVNVASLAIGGGPQLSEIHGDLNYNYRLVDYFPTGGNRNEIRCGEHRDYGTFTIIFQDDVGGLEVSDDCGRWTIVPPGKVIFLWGWSATILSNGRLQAPLHRVVGDPFQVRRNSAIFFVAPDLDAQLKPRLVLPGEIPMYCPRVTDNLSVDQFKNWMGARWRIREGSLLPEEKEEMMKKSFSGMTQDQEIKAFLNGDLMDKI